MRPACRNIAGMAMLPTDEKPVRNLAASSQLSFIHDKTYLSVQRNTDHKYCTSRSNNLLPDKRSLIQQKSISPCDRHPLKRGQCRKEILQNKVLTRSLLKQKSQTIRLQKTSKASAALYTLGLENRSTKRSPLSRRRLIFGQLSVSIIHITKHHVLT
jgi:hypothetical protein